MPEYCALLRAVNVGGTVVKMADLRSRMERLGLSDVRTVLQTGNIIFRAGRQTPAALERSIEAHLARELDLTTTAMVRSVADLQRVLARNPFTNEARLDPAHLVVVFLKAAPSVGAVTALQGAITGREVVRADGNILYAVYPDGIGRSRVTATFIEKHVATLGTGRNWNTVLRLVEATS